MEAMKLWLGFRMVGGLIVTLLACSCSSPAPATKTTAGYVRRVDFSQAPPQLQAMTNHVRQFANELYPRVCTLLVGTGHPWPRQVDIVARPLSSGNSGETDVIRHIVYINSEFVAQRTNDTKILDAIVTHELAHVATMDQTRWERWTQPITEPIGCWGESLADYARYKLLTTNNWWCASCNILYPDYTAGYTCGGAFLLYLDQRFGTNLVSDLARVYRSGRFEEGWFSRVTGQSLEVLWADFQKSSPPVPIVQRGIELRRTLGFVNGVPPKDAIKRFNRYLSEHGSAFARDALSGATGSNGERPNVRYLASLYMYLMQPGGCAEEFVSGLVSTGDLPGFKKGEKGVLNNVIGVETMAAVGIYPMTQTVVWRKNNDPARYRYRVRRDSEGSQWQIVAASRETKEGREELLVQK
jgi:hypothetical protein